MTQKKSVAKAKDSLFEDRTSRGQGQPFRRQNLSRPRTEMLKDTGSSVLKKKSSKFFSGDLQFSGVRRIFVWGRPKPQIT